MPAIRLATRPFVSRRAIVRSSVAECLSLIAKAIGIFLVASRRGNHRRPNRANHTRVSSSAEWYDVLGALSYEGFVAGPARGEAERSLAEKPLSEKPLSEKPLAEAPAEVRKQVKGLTKGKRYRVTVRRVVTPPPNRIDGPETVDGEVRYRRPFHARLPE